MRKTALASVFTAALMVFCAACRTSGGNHGRDDGGSDAGDGGPTESDRQAYDELMSQVPRALCQHYATCQIIEAGEVETCVTEITAEIASDPLDCDAAVEFYIAHRAAIDACLDGSQGTCDSDDVTSFCPAWVGFDFEHGCDAPPDDGGPGDGGTLTLEQAVVGGWSGSGTCQDTELEFGWFLCPGGRLRGFERAGDINFLDCGTWRVEGDLVKFSGTSTDTIIGDEGPMPEWEANYEGGQLFVGACNVPLSRVQGTVGAEDCTGGACSAGGTGDVSCSIDCDCGRCWYCESGTCRYAGEGPYGCYRGCGP
jgi:hypothetical protein